MKLIFKTFPGHKGRPGKVGGSVPRKFRDEERPYRPGGKKANIHVWHGTSADFVDSIIQNGLKASAAEEYTREVYGDERASSVYFTTDKRVAHAYGEGTATEEYAVVAFHIPIELEKTVKFDEVDYDNFGMEHNWRIEQNIPPEWLSEIEIYNSDSGKLVRTVQYGDLLKARNWKEGKFKTCYAVVGITGK